MIIEYTSIEIADNEGTEVRFERDRWESDLGDSPVSVRRLFTDAQQNYGKCVKKMYQKQALGGKRMVGWVFAKETQETTRVETRIRLLRECPHCGGSGRNPVVIG